MNKPLLVLCTVAATALLTVTVTLTVAAQNAKSRSPATPPTSADEPPPRKKKLSRQAYRDEVTRLIEDVGLNCKADNECDAIALGAKICGGPAEYLTISRAVTAKYGDRLGELQATISELDKAQHKESGMMGICTVLEKPNSRCLNSRCQVSH